MSYDEPPTKKEAKGSRNPMARKLEDRLYRQRRLEKKKRHGKNKHEELSEAFGSCLDNDFYDNDK